MYLDLVSNNLPELLRCGGRHVHAGCSQLGLDFVGGQYRVDLFVDLLNQRARQLGRG